MAEDNVSQSPAPAASESGIQSFNRKADEATQKAHEVITSLVDQVHQRVPEAGSEGKLVNRTIDRTMEQLAALVGREKGASPSQPAEAAPAGDGSHPVNETIEQVVDEIQCKEGGERAEGA